MQKKYPLISRHQMGNYYTVCLSHGFKLLLIATILIGMAACDKEQEAVPTYLQIDSCSLLVKSNQGSASNEFSVVQCYINQEFIGNFELPAKIPILKSGNLRVQLIPAVRVNGSRTQYRGYNLVDMLDTTLSFSRTKVTVFSNPKFKFRNNADLVWVDDFEQGFASLIKPSQGGGMPKGDTAFVESLYYNLGNRFKGNSRVFSLKFAASDTLKIADFISAETFKNLPNIGQDVILELDIQSPLEVQIALSRKKPGQSAEYVPFLITNATGGIWKKFYLFLNAELANQPNGTDYTVLINIDKRPAFKDAAVVNIDNIRLGYLK